MSSTIHSGLRAALFFVAFFAVQLVITLLGTLISTDLVGNSLLLVLYFLLICRAAVIAATASTAFSRMLAGSIAVIFFTYTFVNIGMVSGILPVVGVPLPFMSYGGTALVILGMCVGILMSINADKKPEE